VETLREVCRIDFRGALREIRGEKRTRIIQMISMGEWMTLETWLLKQLDV
jgi:hypothetical protein